MGRNGGSGVRGQCSFSQPCGQTLMGDERAPTAALRQTTRCPGGPSQELPTAPSILPQQPTPSRRRHSTPRDNQRASTPASRSGGATRVSAPAPCGPPPPGEVALEVEPCPVAVERLPECRHDDVGQARLERTRILYLRRRLAGRLARTTEEPGRLGDRADGVQSTHPGDEGHEVRIPEDKTFRTRLWVLGFGACDGAPQRGRVWRRGWDSDRAKDRLLILTGDPEPLNPPETLKTA